MNHDELIASYRRIPAIQLKFDFAHTLGATLGNADTAQISQGVFEEILTDQERQDWLKWTSPGTATDEEWAVIKSYGEEQA